ncbi:MAG: NAD-dependent epimerase/dehydratase family protein [Actinomycetota bacterium]
MSTHLHHPVVLGAGPVGRAVVARLVERGAHPTVVTRSGTELVGADAVAADVTDPVVAKTVLGHATAVFQCAQPPYHRWAEEFPGLQRTIVEGCEAAGAHLIALENLYGYGRPDGPMTEDHPMRPHTAKGRVRAAMWDELHAAHTQGRVRTAAVRASDFFGPGVAMSTYGERFFPRLLAGRKAELLGDPETRHSITYVPDVAAAMVRVAEDESAWGRAWHVPTAPAITQREIVELAAEAAGAEATYTEVHRWMLRLAGLVNPGAKETIEMLYEFEHDFVIDSSAFEARFDMTATPLATALDETIEWFRGQAS